MYFPCPLWGPHTPKPPLPLPFACTLGPVPCALRLGLCAAESHSTPTSLIAMSAPDPDQGVNQQNLPLPPHPQLLPGQNTQLWPQAIYIEGGGYAI